MKIIFGFGKSKKQNATYTEYTSASDIFLNGKTNDFVFCDDVFSNYLVKRCIQVNAMHTSKANAKVIRRTDDGIIPDTDNSRVENLLNTRPNPQMSGRDFLLKVRSLCELDGTAFILVDKDYTGKVLGYYPIQSQGYYAITDDTRTIIKGFRFNVMGQQLDFTLNEVAVIRRDFAQDRYFGTRNTSLYDLVRMQMVTDKGLEKAIKLTTSLMGIIKESKAMMDKNDTKKSRDKFVSDYLGLNDSGIASLDSTSEFIPINIAPKTANVVQQQMYDERIMLYFGTNKNILMNQQNEDEWDAYYEGCIAPFLIGLSQELTNKSFTDREIAFGNIIVYESNKLMYASASTKLSLAALVDRGVLGINELRDILNLPPVDGGDINVIRKDYTQTGNLDNKKSKKKRGER